MKLKIKKIREVYSTNIFGKPLKTQTHYRIYRRTLLGKMWLFYHPVEDGKFAVRFDYDGNSTFKDFLGYSNKFKTHGSAANFIKGIETNPDNYIRMYETCKFAEAFLLHNPKINK